MKKVLIRCAQVLVTIGVLCWVFRDPKMRAEIPVVLGKADLRWLLLGMTFSGLAELANIFRWQIFLRVQKVRVPLLRTAVVFMIGVFFNAFLFGATGGDVVRAAYLAADQEDKKTGVILSVIVDRLIGMVVLVPFCVGVVTLRYHWFRQSASSRTLYWFLITFMIATTLFFAFAITVTKLGVTDKLPKWMSRRKKLMRVIEACALVGRSWREMLVAYALSIPVLFFPFVTFWCSAKAFSANVTLVDIFCIMPIVTVATSLPISFSGIGVREELFKHLLGDLAGVPAQVAVLISLAGFLSYISWSFVGAVIWLVSRPARPKG